MTTPARDHTDCTYGAIAVGQPRPEDADRPQPQRRYDITWLCCGTAALMNQKELNVRRGNHPGQCLDCRNAGKAPVWTPATPPPPKSKIGPIDVPGMGLFQPLTGFTQAASKLDRSWAD